MPTFPGPHNKYSLFVPSGVEVSYSPLKVMSEEKKLPNCPSTNVRRISAKLERLDRKASVQKRGALLEKAIIYKIFPLESGK